MGSGEMALNPDGPAMRPAERRRLFPRPTVKAHGYYAPPGSGPAGHTCGDCKHMLTHQPGNRAFHKCALTDYTFGPATDIRVRSPACRGWEREDGRPRDRPRDRGR